MSAPEIRIVSERDLRDLAALVAGFRDHLGVPSPTDAELGVFLPECLADPLIEFACAYRDGQPAGYAHTRYHTSLWSSGIGAHLEDLFVIEGERGSGLGRALIDFAIERARTRGARFLSLSTNENNAAGQRFYGRVGFVPMSEPLYGDGREISLVLRLG